MTVTAQKETLGFETEVKQILNLVVHSLYSNKEIFLRELISNASDAMDKLRFTALSNANLYENDSDLKIQVLVDEAAKTITVIDNGIGMSRQEVIENLGTIAKSGTREFLAQLGKDEAQKSLLIGQFGVGFYSAFIIADKVTVKTRRAGAPANEGVLWESAGEGEYTIETIDLPHRGTEITLHIRKEDEDFLSDWRLRSIIHKYSDHITWPIVMKKISPEIEEGEKSAEDKKAEENKAAELETINSTTALWTMPKSEVKEEEYKELYKHISHDFAEPLTWAHNHVEGKQQYISLLYIPSHAPFDLWHQESKHGLKLYVKRVFIMDDATQFLPRYLRFVKGIIDSNDLPLNISREILQENKMVENIKGASVKRILDLLDKMAKDEPENYTKFWKEFGLVLKEGPIEDHANRERIAKLIRFSTTHTDQAEQTVSLDEYVSRMQPDQEKIYYITAPSFNAAMHSPHLEVFRQKKIEVLLLSDRVDEWLINYLGDFAGKKLQSVTKGALDLGKLAEEKPVDTKVEAEYTGLIKQIKEILAAQVKDVRLTSRLTDSPACLVADENDLSREMERILRDAGQAVPKSQPIFEINPEHPLIKKLHNETDDQRFSEWTHLLFDQAMLAEGTQLEDPAQFVQRLNRVLLELSK